MSPPQKPEGLQGNRVAQAIARTPPLSQILHNSGFRSRSRVKLLPSDGMDASSAVDFCTARKYPPSDKQQLVWTLELALETERSMLHIAALMVGLGFGLAVFLDAFQTMVLPRRPSGRFRITRLFFLADLDAVVGGRQAHPEPQRARGGLWHLWTALAAVAAGAVGGFVDSDLWADVLRARFADHRARRAGDVERVWRSFAPISM